MRARPAAVAALAVLACFSAASGYAASAALSSDSIGATTVSIPRCTAAALTVLQNLSAGNVVSVTVSGLPAGCGGATVQATVNNGAANFGGSSSVPGAGGSVTVTLGTAVAVGTADETDIVVTGP